MGNYEQRISDIESEMNKKCDEPRVREIVKEELELNSCKHLIQNHIVSDFDNISCSVFDFFRHFIQKCSLQRWHSNSFASDSANILLQILQS
jgi:hypothetical protein